MGRKNPNPRFLQASFLQSALGFAVKSGLHKPNRKPALEFFKSITKDKKVIFSAITETELIAGKYNDDDEKRDKLLNFLHNWDKIDINNSIALLAGDIVRKYNTSVPDALIAATCIINDSDLITKNIKDFKLIKELRVISPY